MTLPLLTPAETGLQCVGPNWFLSKDGDPSGLALYQRHYSRYRYADGRLPLLFVGPGHKIVLVNADGTALFVWRKFLSGDGQSGVNCAVFRNESRERSSELILQAEEVAWKRWPTERLYTYINTAKVRSVNPGCCFFKAGWRKCGKTKVNNLLILEKLPLP